MVGAIGRCQCVPIHFLELRTRIRCLEPLGARLPKSLPFLYTREITVVIYFVHNTISRELLICEPFARFVCWLVFPGHTCRGRSNAPRRDGSLPLSHTYFTASHSVLYAVHSPLYLCRHCLREPSGRVHRHKSYPLTNNREGN